jgi:hypothetical protein
MDNEVNIFKSGIHNLLGSEKIPKDAAKASVNFVTKDGKVVLVGGRIALGDEGAVGSCTGLHAGYKTDGSVVIYAKFGTTIKYYDGSAWQDCITGLTADAEYTFANYSSLAGAFTYVNGVDGYWKIVNANPASPIDIYRATRNFKGKIIIDTGRTILWDRAEDKTGLYGSHIDPQDSNVYTTVSSEAIGSSGSTNYTGTLAFKAGGSRRSCFGITFSATVSAGTELFTDNYDGTVTSNFGGTGTVNYATGAYDIDFSDTTTGAVTSDYQWEDSTDGGVADFSKSGTRLAGEGFQFPQDEGGDPILNVLLGQDGAYYSLKEKSAYFLSIDSDDLGATNVVYRKEMGLPFFRAAYSTNRGIFFINTSNPTKPEMTILQRNKVSGNVEPVILFPQFKFSDYVYDQCGFGAYDRWILVFCKTKGAVNNDTILMCDLQGKTVDVVRYTGKMSVQDSEKLYVGDSVTQSVYSTFDGFDDLGLAVEATWDSKDDNLGTENLKKVRRLQIKGLIDPDQAVEVYMNIDKSGFDLVGTLRGDGDYVDYNQAQVIGASMIGTEEIGGGDGTSVFPYFIQLRLRTGKFRTIGIRLKPIGIGYFDFDMRKFWDILPFENRIPKQYRQKQNVSLDGTQTDQ